MPVGISLPMVLVKENTTFTDPKTWTIQIGETARVSVVYLNSSNNLEVKWGSLSENFGVVGESEVLDLTTDPEGVAIPAVSSAAASVMQLSLPAGTVIDFLAVEMI